MGKTIVARKRRQVSIDPRTVAVVFVNLAFLAAIWRAGQYVWAITGSVSVTALVVLAVGVPVYVWEMLYHYRHANKAQVIIAVTGMLVDITAGVWYGTLDYWHAAGLDTGADTQTVLAVAAVLLALHALAAGAWYLVDDNVANARRLAREMAEATHFARVQETMRRALEERAKTTDQLADLADQYGVDAVRAMIEAAGYDADEFAALFGDTARPQLPMRAMAADVALGGGGLPTDEPDFPAAPRQ